MTSFITTTIPVMTVTNIIGNFVSLTTFMTAAGLTLTTAMTTMMTMESRMANVEVTVHRSNGIILTTFGRSRILATLPPATAPRPYVLTITIQPLVVIFSDAIVIISPLPSVVGVAAFAHSWHFGNNQAEELVCNFGCAS